MSLARSSRCARIGPARPPPRGGPPRLGVGPLSRCPAAARIRPRPGRGVAPAVWRCPSSPLAPGAARPCRPGGGPSPVGFGPLEPVAPRSARPAVPPAVWRGPREPAAPVRPGPARRGGGPAGGAWPLEPAGARAAPARPPLGGGPPAVWRCPLEPLARRARVRTGPRRPGGPGWR